MKQMIMALALVFLVLGTAGGTSGAAPASGEPIRIGAISSLTGSFATFGSMERAGYALAVDDINTAGGLNGRPLVIDLQDDTSSANTALTVAEQFINSGVPLILGAYSSSVTKPLAVYMARQRVPLLNSNSADDSITKPGSDYVFRVGQNTDAYVKPFFALFKQLGTIKTIAILVSNNALGHSVENSLLTQAKDGGYPVVFDQAYDEGLTDFRPVLNRIKDTGADVLAMSSYEADAVALMRQIKEVNLNAKIFAGAGATGFAIPSFLKGGGDTVEYVITSAAWSPDVHYPKAHELFARLKAFMGGAEPSYHAIRAYAGATVAADALRRAATLSPEGIRAALQTTSLTTPFGTVEFKDFSGFHNQNPLPSILMQVQHRAYVTVWPLDVAVGKVIYPTPVWTARK
ncbi:MAG: amino acid ABC transporter substrate-binding protein [Bacillati bacterium ANGP1]|uniref:Amino acid ABC transporter substrate-binding protein n=1 Tax=Candidatus Segetimicrobium genomatis TaxID=2569760 RepID=A0A537LWV0_9BACT|nr:MAG: amino acid ABC transporter substrate-binding protein [Terrabacteria group bacterium ANGP1]